jgi:hypothetical protein
MSEHGSVRYDPPVTALPYRVPAPGPPDPYMVAWAGLRKRRLVGRVAAGVLGYSLVTTGVVAWTTGLHVLSALALALVVITFAVILSQRQKPFLCPRCGGPFFWGGPAEIGFTKHCESCGIAVGTSMMQSAAEGPGDGERLQAVR